MSGWVPAASMAMTPDRAGRIDKVFSEWSAPTGPGCTLGIVDQGRVVYERGYGMANLEYGLPNKPDTVFYVASVSKQFTAAAMALLAEEGRVSLDDDIRRYVPEIPAYDKPILIRHLIHHTSGLRDYAMQWYDAGRGFSDSIAEKDLIAHIAGQDGLDFSPGSQYHYSNSGYFLLGVIVKRASGKSLREYAQEKIFAPLKMVDTRFRDDRRMIVPRRATAYQYPHRYSREGGLGAYQTSFDLVGDGGLLTTVRDLYRWDQNFYHNTLGQRGQAFIDELLSAEPLTDGTPNNYLFGLKRESHKGMPAIVHAGSFIGYQANIIRLPGPRISVIALCNGGNIPVVPMTKEVLDIYMEKAKARGGPSASDARTQ